MMEQKISNTAQNAQECTQKHLTGKDHIDVPYIVHEGILARFERVNKRLWVLVTLLIILLVGSNVGWLIYESQYQITETTQTVTQDTQGGDNNRMVGIDYGETDSDTESADPS